MPREKQSPEVPPAENQAVGLFDDLYEAARVQQTAIYESRLDEAKEKKSIADRLLQASGPFDRFQGNPTTAVSEAKALLGLLGFSVDEHGDVKEEDPKKLKATSEVYEAWVSAQQAVHASSVLSEFKNLAKFDAEYRKALQDLAGHINEEEIKRRFATNAGVKGNATYVVNELKKIAADIYGNAGQEATQRADKAFLATDEAKTALERFPALNQPYEVPEATPKLAIGLYKNRLIQNISGVDPGTFKKIQEDIAALKEKSKSDSTKAEQAKTSAELDRASYEQALNEFKLDMGAFWAEKITATMGDIVSNLSDEEQISFFETAPVEAKFEYGSQGKRDKKISLNKPNGWEKLLDEQRLQIFAEVTKVAALQEYIGGKKNYYDHPGTSLGYWVGVKDIQGGEAIDEYRSTVWIKDVPYIEEGNFWLVKPIETSYSNERSFFYSLVASLTVELKFLRQLKKSHPQSRDSIDRLLRTREAEDLTKNGLTMSQEGIPYKERDDVVHISKEIKNIEAQKPKAILKQLTDTRLILTPEAGVREIEKLRAGAVRAIVEGETALEQATEELANAQRLGKLRDERISELERQLAEVEERQTAATNDSDKTLREIQEKKRKTEQEYDELHTKYTQQTQTLAQAQRQIDSLTQINSLNNETSTELAAARQYAAEQAQAVDQFLSALAAFKPTTLGGKTKAGIEELAEQHLKQSE